MSRPTLDDAQRKVIGNYLRQIADKLYLRDWTVTVMHAPPSEPDLLAEVDSDPGVIEAKFHFRPDFGDLDPDEVRTTVVHEVIHVHRRSIVHLNAATLRDDLSSDRWNTWLAAYSLLDEQATEALAQAIAPLMPEFPGWPKASKGEEKVPDSEPIYPSPA